MIATDLEGARILRTGIQALVRRFSISERADVQCCGMTVAQAATLEALRDGALRLGHLGQRLGIAPSTLSRNLSRLEESGLVQRRADAEDGRAFLVELTSAGRRAAERLEVQELAFAGAVLNRLGKQRGRRALEGLGDLLEALRAETEDCCGEAYEHLMEGAASARTPSSSLPPLSEVQP